MNINKFVIYIKFVKFAKFGEMLQSVRNIGSQKIMYMTAFLLEIVDISPFKIFSWRHYTESTFHS